MSVIADRLRKNIKRLRPWANRLGFEAFRLYDWDIPEYPFYVDLYGDEWVVSDKSNSGFARDQQHLDELIKTLPLLATELGLAPDAKLHLKRRMTQTRTEKYEKSETAGERKVVREGPCRFWVNLSEYLDTGLFLDHRPLRERLRKETQGQEVLNLFCYTGSISVASALGGARVTSVDLSTTYLDWAQDNFRLNDLDPSEHHFIRDDVLQFLARPGALYDTIILDPPIFSNSKKMLDVLDTQRDHPKLVDGCMRRLKTGGKLYFSTNKQGFKIAPELNEHYHVQDITAATIPKDFHRPKVHVCYLICQRT